MQHSDQHISVVNLLSTDKDFAFPIFISALFRYYNIVSFFEKGSTGALAFKSLDTFLLYRRERRQFIYISYSVCPYVVISSSFTADISNESSISDNYFKARDLVTFSKKDALVVSKALL